MGVRGRKSLAALTVSSKASQIEVVERQKPPHDLTDEETEIWASITASQAADWFDAASVPLLTQYCRHVVRARHIGEMIESATGKMEELALEDYDRLLKMQQRESMAMASLSTKMRINPQSLTNHRGNKKPNASRKLWES